jgi:hypothetical protein
VRQVIAPIPRTARDRPTRSRAVDHQDAEFADCAAGVMDDADAVDRAGAGSGRHGGSAMTDWAAFPRDVTVVLLLIVAAIAVIYVVYLVLRRR